MKILLVSGVYPPRIGGPSLQTQRIAQGLIDRGISVKVVTYGSSARSESIEGVPVTFLDGNSPSGAINKLQYNWQKYRDLYRIIQEFQPTVIQMQTAAGNLAFLTGIIARQQQIPTLLKYTGDLAWEKANAQKLSDDRAQTPILSTIQRSLFALYSRIWATTPLFESRLLEDFRIAPQKVLLLPNFIDLQPFEAIAQSRTSTESIDRINLLTVARLRPWKGVDICIEAIAKLSDLPVHLKIVGDGEDAYVRSLKDLAQQFKVSDRVEFAGAVPPEQVAEAYRTAHLFLLASQYEPFGIVLLEAMAAQVPIVATAVGGIPQVVEAGVSAQLVPPSNADALAAAIRSIATDSAKRQQQIAAAADRVKAFGLDQGIDALIETYADLAAQSCQAASPLTVSPVCRPDRIKADSA